MTSWNYPDVDKVLQSFPRATIGSLCFLPCWFCSDKVTSDTDICRGGTFWLQLDFRVQISLRSNKMALRCTLSVNSNFSGFKLQPGPTDVFVPVCSL